MGLVFLPRFTLLSMGSDTTVTDVVRFVVLYMVLPLSTNVVESGILGTSPSRSTKFARDVRLSDFSTTSLGIAPHYVLTTLP